jgi:hypothetical protein
VSGELISLINLMPGALPSYTLTYTLIPMKLGILRLPCLSILDQNQKKQAIIDSYHQKVFVTHA